MFCFFRSAVRVKQFLFLLTPFSLFGHSHTLSTEIKRTQLFGVWNKLLRSINQKVVLLVLPIHFLSSTSSKLYDSFRALLSTLSLLLSPSFSLFWLFRFIFRNTSSKWLGRKHTLPDSPSSGELTREIPPQLIQKENTLRSAQIQATFGLWHTTTMMTRARAFCSVLCRAV